ncbi:MAG: serine/threonine-protein kinase [Pseudomonadota bacterium]
MRKPSADPVAHFAGRYALLERLHTGPVSEVWLAHDERADIAVALKQLHPNAAEKPLLLRAFQREYDIARSLNHQHTVRVLNWHDGERPTYAMQYVDGTDFSSLVGLPAERWLPAVLVIVDTLDYWHRKGIVHGDVKPANCLIDRRGVAYLADFSTAAVVDDTAVYDSRGGSGAYASPEQQQSLAPHPADDVYAIAKVIIEMVSGTPDADIPESLAPGLSAALRQALLPRDSRLSAAALRDALAQAGVQRGAVDLDQLQIKLRRPAAAVAGAVEPRGEALPHGAFERPERVREPQRDGVSLQWVLLGLLLIVAVGVAVTFGLSALRGGDDPATPVPADSQAQPQAPAEAPATATPPPAVTQTGDRASADSQVAELISLIATLESRGVERWGGANLETGLARYAEGDRAYLAADYAQAVARYDDALAILKPLLESVDARFDAAMREADAAMRAEDALAARAAYELALAITPTDPIAQRGLERANNLDAVLAKMAEGRVAERAGELATAVQRYREAITLDGEWLPAIEARDRLEAAIAADRFASNMSQGLQAMSGGDFLAARRAFDAAAALRPRDPGPKDALLQLQLAERLERINGLQSQAQDAESSEQWALARQRYNDMLSIDASLDVAKAGALRAAERLALMNEMADVLRNPDRLSDLDNLRDASQLLTRASDVEPRGPQLSARIDAMTQLLTAVAVPLPVELRSDGLTSVTLLRVERLGTFDVKEIRLRPGLYTLVGSRRGYVDTRMQFRVRAGQTMEPVFIACEQPL